MKQARSHYVIGYLVPVIMLVGFFYLSIIFPKPAVKALLLGLGLPLVSVILVALVVDLRKDPSIPDNVILVHLSDVLLAAAAAVLFGTLFMVLPDFVRYLAKFPQRLITVCGSLSLAGIGFALYRLKVRKLKWYALTELGFAVFACSAAAFRSTEHFGLAEASVAVAAIYLVVRGLDNLRNAEALIAEKEKSQQPYKGAYQELLEKAKRERLAKGRK